MEKIEWRTTAVRGKSARNDLHITLTGHAGRKPQLRIGFRKKAWEKNPFKYVAISDFSDDPDRIYLMLSDIRKASCQNTLYHGKTGGVAVLFTLKEGEEEIIKKWCEKEYDIKHLYGDVYYIEREVTE